MQPDTRKQSIAVVGGGMTGIAAALELAKSGEFRVTIFEKENRLGGLSSWYEWQDVICDRFYHVVLSTDGHLIDLLEELGLGSQLSWKDTQSGFYGEGRMVSFSGVSDFLRFPFLSLWQKFRLGLGILYSSRVKNMEKIDRTTAGNWLTKVFGAGVYENFWGPLLRSKLGEAKDRTSAAFILATIKRLYSARSSGNKQEKMGHVHGGYRTILDAAQKRLSEMQIQVKTNAPVFRVSYGDDRTGFVLTTKAEEAYCDRLLFTTPCPETSRIMGHGDDNPYWEQLREVEYLGVICVLLILKRSLSPYYVLNLLDKDLPFTGVIESTNVWSPDEVGGNYLVYLPKYLTKNESLHGQSDEDIIELFTDELKRIFPDLLDDEIRHSAVFREDCTQPILGLGFLERFRDFRTPVPYVYQANTLSIKDSTLNNNAAIQVAKKAAKVIRNDRR